MSIFQSFKNLLKHILPPPTATFMREIQELKKHLNTVENNGKALNDELSRLREENRKLQGSLTRALRKIDRLNTQHPLAVTDVSGAMGFEESPPYSYYDFHSMAQIIKDHIKDLPTDFDLVVGIPRSGMIPAYMIALFLNKRACSLDEFIEGRLPSVGIRNVSKDSIQNVLIVDDSVRSGRAQRLLREKLDKMNCDNYTIKTLAVFATDASKNKVDYYFEITQLPRIFQWNYLYHPDSKNWCFDIDGIFNRDPTETENDDGDNYRNFLSTVPALFIPNYPILALVTSRLEKYRPETETWLKKNGIQYEHLFMLDLPTKEERQKKNAHAKFKAEIYQSLPNATLFVESESRQAEEIALLSGKPCICTQNDCLYL